jgi:hypothetical protein
MQQVVMPFDGNTVEVIKNEVGEAFVSVKSICRAIGVTPENQIEKIKQDSRFIRCDITSVAEDGKNRVVFCIPLSQLNGWLFSINPNKVPERIRQNLIAYQQECFQVLYKHFMPRGEVDLQPLMDRLTNIENVCRGIRDEVDELRATLNLLINEDDEKMIRELIRRIKDKYNCDGRAVVGKVRATLNVGSIYETPDTRKVINTLKNLLGEGLTLVKEENSECSK